MCPLLFKNSALGSIEFHGRITKRMMVLKNFTNLRINGILDEIENDSLSETKIKCISFLIDNEV
ncbi:hypothetical protein BpHYR1_044345 [Brachionus plicatilis]|uniref:Uncharacterized protein n=1 Tax=Brachionus plicatilis TaxID=10195 RepID=A0A3M7QPV7_BRAPC|nr:hypothetical protein BpHYR1_044345 [Brachionus plicatilis]